MQLALSELLPIVSGFLTGFRSFTLNRVKLLKTGKDFSEARKIVANRVGNAPAGAVERSQGMKDSKRSTGKTDCVPLALVRHSPACKGPVRFP